MQIKYVHTNIIAKDWRKLMSFYINVFDCRLKPVERNLSGKWLVEGTAVPNARLQGVHLLLPGYPDDGPTLEIYQYEINQEKPPTHANREGFGHMAFLVEDVEKMMEKVMAHGGKAQGKIVEQTFDYGHLTFVYVLDPEGNILELQNWR